MFTSLQPELRIPFMVTTMIIAVPTGIKIFGWLGTIWGGKIRFTSAMLFSLGFLSMFVIGGISGVMLAAVPFDYQAHDTYFVVSHFHFVLFGGLAYAVYDRGRAAWQMQQHLAALDVTAVHSDAMLARVIGRLGFPPSRVHLVGGLPNPAFTVGWLTPHIFVAHALSQTLPEAELEAVLAHEVAHVRRRDPLRLFLLRGLANTLFWLPAIRRLVEDLADEAEIAADDAVAPSLRLALASAMLRVARTQGDVTEPAIGFHQNHMMERRIRRLAGEAPLVVSHVSRRSIAAAAIALLAVWASGVMVLHPLPDMSTSAGMRASGAHCGHTTQSAWSHLFCEGALRAEIHCSMSDVAGQRSI
jgi:Zn-dependent protease with chaperone function